MCRFYAGGVTDAAPTPEFAEDAAPGPVGAAEPSAGSPRSELEGATAMIEETEGLLSDVEAALERLESGQYRTCEICGAPLDAPMLVGAPTLRRCLAHAA